MAGEVVMRDQFTFQNLLPGDLADAVELIQQPLPTDPLSATGTLLCGYSGLLKIGTRVASSYQHSVPCNLFWANVGVSGLAKTPIKQRLVDEPASTIRLIYKHEHEDAVERWQSSCSGQKKDERPPKPKPKFPHAGGNYSPEALDIQLELHEKAGLGLLILRDELSGLLQALDSDSKRGRGTGEAQLLELFDGTGNISLRVDGTRHYEKCHASLFGNIQPERLRHHVNGDDATGKWARILFNQVPTRPLELQYEDPTEMEKMAYSNAQKTLADYALKLHQRHPETIEVDKEARRLLIDWFHGHQLQALAPTTSSVVSALLGKTSAHAMRLAGLFHLVHSINSNKPKEKITADHMQTAINIVDVLTSEIRLFHSGPEEPRTELMRLVHSASWNRGSPQPIRWQDAKEKLCTTRALRELRAGDFYGAIEEWEELGFGSVSRTGTVTYTAVRPLPG